MRSVVVPVALAIGFLAGCSSNLPPLPAASTSNEYTLGPGDEIRVITFGDDKLTAQFHVGDDGTIAMPLLGNVQASGKTPTQLGQEIGHQLLAKELLVNPSVSVEILNYRPIFVLGEVTRPGQYPYQPGMTVIQAVSMAGGYTYRAIQDQADVVRKQGNESHPLEGLATKNSVLEPGDVVNVQEKLF
jgi:polysaccharide export outer membrane protein